jgi:cytosine/adenosine deaminase-related metal-dependent hydrolase
MSSAGSLPRGHVLIRGATILSLDPDIGELDRGDIEVRDGVIAAVASEVEGSGAEVLDATGCIAIPGFVDTHWHAWGTLMRGAIGDGPEHGWFARKGRLGPWFTPEDTAAGVRLALAEGLLAGFTTVHDWAHNVLSAADADANLGVHAELGLRTHFSYGAPSASPHLSAEQMAAVMESVGKRTDEPMDFDDIERIQADWLPRGDGRLSLGVNVRGPSRSTPEVYREEFARARALRLPIAMHCAGTRQEVERIRQVEVLEAEGLLADDVLLAHGNWLSAEERAICGATGVPVSVSPLVELRLAMGWPQVRELRSAGVTVSLSLDTTALAAVADPFAQMRLAVGLENVRHGDAEALSPRAALEMATLHGARSLGLADVTGSLTPGKRADLVLLRADAPNIAPMVDPAVAVVHSATPANVEVVMADGRLLVRDGQLVAADIEAIVGEARERLARLAERAGLPLPAAPSSIAG